MTENARHIHRSAGRRKELSYPAYETHFLLKSTKFRAPAISQKRILCETSFKNGNEVAQFKSIVPAMKRGTLMSPNIAQATKSATPMSPTFCHATKRPSSIAKYNAPVASDAPQPPHVFFLCLLLSLTFSLCLFLPVACSCLTLSVTYSFVTISFCSFLSFLSLCPFLSVSFLVLLFSVTSISACFPVRQSCFLNLRNSAVSQLNFP